MLERLLQAGFEEAEKRGESWLCGEHLLLALLDESFVDAPAARALRAGGIERAQVERMLDALGAEPEAAEHDGVMTTAMLQEILGFANGFAAARGERATATDVLVAYVWDPWLAAHLASHGLVRDALLDRLEHAGEPVPPIEPPPFPSRPM